MWSILVNCQVFILIYFMSITAQCVILRPFRYNQSLLETTTPPAARAANTTQIIRRTRYVPTDQRCCGIGQRAARKNMFCDITNLAVFRKWENFTSLPSKKARKKRKDKFSEKISICSAAFPKDFELCCKHKGYFQQKKKCQKKPKKLREKCKLRLRKRYS